MAGPHDDPRADAVAGSRNWGRWGPDDERGALNLLTGARVRAAARLVTTGEVLSLALPLSQRTAMPAGRPGLHHAMMRDAGDYALGGRVLGRSRFSDDVVMLATHTGTHIDALAHVWYGDELYNGFDQAAIRSTGARRCGVDKLGPVVGRGVLIDVAGHLRTPALNAGQAVGRGLLADTCRTVSIDVRPGDVVLMRTGWLGRHAEEPAGYFEGEPGLDLDGAAWLAERDVAAVGADNYAVEQLPPVSDEGFPVHEFLLRDHGIPLMEGMVLDALASRDVREFLFMAAPLPLQGGTASPIVPLAVL